MNNKQFFCFVGFIDFQLVFVGLWMLFGVFCCLWMVFGRFSMVVNGFQFYLCFLWFLDGFCVFFCGFWMVFGWFLVVFGWFSMVFGGSMGVLSKLYFPKSIFSKCIFPKCMGPNFLDLKCLLALALALEELGGQGCIFYF